MKLLLTLTAVSLSLTSAAIAGDAGCKPAGCCPDRNCVRVCRPVCKKVDINRNCFEIETKTICIPATRFPWDPDPCAGMCGKECGKNGACGSNGKCGAGCGADRNCSDGGLFGGLRSLLGLGNGLCGRTMCVKSPKKKSVKIGERCVCEWKIDSCGSGGCKPACASPSTAPPASAPAAPGLASAETTRRIPSYESR